MILVTGSKGFIGSHVCSIFSSHWRKVIAIDRSLYPISQNNKPYPSLNCDIRDRKQVEKIFQQYPISTIIHLASLLNTASQKHPTQASEVNILGSLNILKSAYKFNVNKFIYGSSISVYGSKSCQSKNGVSEIEPAAPEDIYGASKRYVEILGNIYRQQYGIQFISLRIASVIGPGAIKTASRWRSDIVERLGLDHHTETTIPYKKIERIPFVYVEDIANMFDCLANSKQIKFSVYNAPAETWVLNDLAEYIATIDENLRIKFGHLSATGIPKVINAKRFIKEFNFTSLSLKEHLKQISLSKK
jgi:nucleoside-diphosphate-sugar epimerase